MAKGNAAERPSPLLPHRASQPCKRCNGTGVVRPAADNCPRCDGTGIEPAPSQPAGAREQGLVINESINDPALLKVIRWEIVDRSSNRAEWFALCHRREHAERIVDAVNARQQTAAEIAWLRKERHRHVEQLEAAERERDSLREANARLAADLDAALKAGKESHGA